jgi:hypothetical protein
MYWLSAFGGFLLQNNVVKKCQPSVPTPSASPTSEPGERPWLSPPRCSAAGCVCKANFETGFFT